MFLLTTLYWFFYWRFRPLIKWFLKKTTKLCELQRICYGQEIGYSRSAAVDFSLKHSKSDHIKSMIEILDGLAQKQMITGAGHRQALECAVRNVIRAKMINPSINKKFFISFSRCIEHIWGYNQLIEEIEAVRLIQFDSDNEEHETKLLGLWKILKPDTELDSRISRQWQDIGFQGDDPKTDFRGMGILGLDNLIFFAEEYNTAALHVLSRSLHPVHGYCFAIVGINLTALTFHLLKDGTAKTHVYNMCKGLPSLRVFHQMYCYLFYEFDKFWIESKPRDMMEFPYVRAKFESNIRSLLSNPQTVFKINFAVNSV